MATVKDSRIADSELAERSGAMEHRDRLQEQLMTLREELEARQAQQSLLEEQLASLEEESLGKLTASSAVANASSLLSMRHGAVCDEDVAAKVEGYIAQDEATDSALQSSTRPFVMVRSAERSLKIYVTEGLTFKRLAHMVFELLGVPGGPHADFALTDIDGATFPPSDFVRKYLHHIPADNILYLIQMSRPTLRDLLGFNPETSTFSVDMRGPVSFVKVETAQMRDKVHAEMKLKVVAASSLGHKSSLWADKELSKLQRHLLRKMVKLFLLVATYMAAVAVRRSVNNEFWVSDTMRAAVLAQRFGERNHLNFSSIATTDDMWEVRSSM